MIKLPKNWDEVLLDQYIAIRQVEKSEMIDKSIEILSILTDTLPDDDIWEDMDIDEMLSLVNEIKWISREPNGDLQESLGEYRLKDINKLTLGEFIDLDYYFSTNYIENLPQIIGILYRKVKQDEWGNTAYEPLGSYDVKSRGEEFLEEPVSKVYGLIKLFLDFKQMTAREYSNLFEPEIVDDVEEEDLQDPDYIEEEKIAETYKKWAWENILYKFSGGDITKYEKITALPVIFVFNQMSFVSEMKL